MCGNIWKINFESALFVTMMERESKLCVHLLLSYFCLFNFKFSTLFAPYHNQAFQCFFCFFSPATLPTVCLRLYNAVTIYSRLIKYNDRTGWTDMNLSKLSAVERLHELKAMKRSLLIPTVSSWSHGQILSSCVSLSFIFVFYSQGYGKLACQPVHMMIPWLFAYSQQMQGIILCMLHSWLSHLEWQNYRGTWHGTVPPGQNSRNLLLCIVPWCKLAISD